MQLGLRQLQFRQVAGLQPLGLLVALDDLALIVPQEHRHRQCLEQGLPELALQSQGPLHRLALTHLPGQLLARAPDQPDDTGTDQQRQQHRTQPEPVADPGLLGQYQPVPAQFEIVILLAGEGHQTLLHHPGKPGAVPTDGKPQPETLRQLPHLQPVQLVVAKRVLQLIELGQHGVGRAALYRRDPRCQGVALAPVMFAIQAGQHLFVIEGGGHRYPALHRRQRLERLGLAAHQGITADRHDPGKVEGIGQRRRLQQADHHVSLAALQLGQRLFSACGGDHVEVEPGLLAHQFQHVRAPPLEIALLVEAVVGHQIRVDHQLDGAGGADQPGLLLVGEVERVDVLLPLRQVAVEILIEGARRQVADGGVDQLAQRRFVPHHQPVAHHQLVAAQAAQPQPGVRVFAHQVTQLQVVAEVGRPLARRQRRVPVVRLGQGLLG